MSRQQILLIVLVSMTAMQLDAAGKSKVISPNIDAVLKEKPDVQKKVALSLYFRAQPLILLAKGIPTEDVLGTAQMATAHTKCAFEKNKSAKEFMQALEYQLGTVRVGAEMDPSVQVTGEDAVAVARGKLGILEGYYQQLIREIDKDRVVRFDDVFQITLPDRLMKALVPKKLGAKKEID